MLSQEEIEDVIQRLEGVYFIRVKRKYDFNPKSHIRAMYTPNDNTITFFNPIETTPYHEYGHAVWHWLKRKYRVMSDSETFAQRFSLMWLNINLTGFRCKCGSQRLVPASPVKNPSLRLLWVKCLDCGTVYKLKNPLLLQLHYNP